MLENKLEIRVAKDKAETEEQARVESSVVHCDTPIIGESKKSRNNQTTCATTTVGNKSLQVEGKNGSGYSAFFALASLNLPYINDKLNRMKEPSMYAQEVFDQLESAKESSHVEQIVEKQVSQISVDEEFGRKMTSTDLKERKSGLVSVGKKEFSSFQDGEKRVRRNSSKDENASNRMRSDSLD